jgi:hypothetical protein
MMHAKELKNHRLVATGLIEIVKWLSHTIVGAQGKKNLYALKTRKQGR